MLVFLTFLVCLVIPNVDSQSPLFRVEIRVYAAERGRAVFRFHCFYGILHEERFAIYLWVDFIACGVNYRSVFVPVSPSSSC